MKKFAPVITLILLASCAHHQKDQHVAGVGTAHRSIAQVQGVARKFLSSALSSGDNLAYKTVSEMESKLLSDIKANPARFGMTEEASKKLKSLDDIKSERVLAEVLSEAPGILKFGAKARSAAINAIGSQSALASQITLKSLDVSAIKLSAAEQSGLGREVSLRLKNLKSSLVKRGVASESQAAKIYENLFQAAKDLSVKAKGDPGQMLLARQIIDYSTAISERTGKQFLGKGGCMKISGKAVLENKADIAFRTLNDVEAQRLSSYDEIGQALQKNHAEVTNRTTKEACMAVQALTVGRSCGGVYSPSLAPKDC